MQRPATYRHRQRHPALPHPPESSTSNHGSPYETPRRPSCLREDLSPAHSHRSFPGLAILGLGIWPARYQSVFAQQVSPFAAPNYSHSSLPGTCILGGLNYTTDYAMLAYCIGTGGTYSYVPTVSNPVTTLNNIPQYTSTNGILSATGLAVAQTSTSNAIVQGNGTTIDQSWMPSVFPITVTNDGTTGTTNGLLAKINSAQHAIKLLTTDTAVQAYVVVTGGGTTGSARLAMTGTVTCTMEAAAGEPQAIT